MIYAESLRHFVQEWYRVIPPKNFPDWPWRKDDPLYLINLYAISAPDVLSKRPKPFISILINNLPHKGKDLIGEDDTLYKGYFQGSYALPRRYLLDLSTNGEKRFKTNRYSYTSDGYGVNARDWNRQDLTLLRILASRPHLRCSIYDNQEFLYLRRRLDHVGDRNDFQIQTTENLLDCTDRITGAQVGIVPPGKVAPKVELPGRSPELMIIQAPITGILSPIKKDQKYRIINGTFLCCREPIVAALQEEPCYAEYQKELVPFKGISQRNTHHGNATQNAAKNIVYVAVEASSGAFNFTEYMPSHIITSNEMNYARMIQHSFMIVPETVGETIEVRLRHNIQEGLIPSIPENHGYLSRRNEKLFYRSDVPDGYIKRDGVVINTNSMI